MPNYSRTRRACFFTYIASAAPFALPAMLFVTFREAYGVSDTLLGTLVLVNFLTQLGIDLLFSFFSKYFNIKLTVRVMPILTSVGLCVYALIPSLFPQYAYVGLLCGTVIFSLAAGLGEVLISPLVAALPSKNPGRDMSLLHSMYAWGVLFVVIVSTVFLWLFGNENWMYLTLIFAALPIVLFVLFCISPIPDMSLGHGEGSGDSKRMGFGIALFVLCIFLGGAAEGGMTTWISAYVERALGIPKAIGDVFGLAIFVLLLGLGRILYARFGKRIDNILLLGMIGASVCYLVAGISTLPVISMIACVLTGLCTSMLWPGTLIMMEEKFPAIGVTAYALMASGGDLGCSVAPQLLGILSDAAGMKVAMTVGTVFPAIGILVIIFIKRYFKKT
jgi:MFS family permease